MKELKKLKSVMLIYMCFCLCLSLISCGEKDYSGKTVNFATYDNVSTFDPQLAKTSAEITIASNCFENLFVKDENGEIKNGMVKSYTVSKDEKIYTFTLRTDAVWSDGETKVSAKDFEFGIKRAIKPETASPYVSALYSIKNAEKINKGKAKLENLGVKAEENTLTIRLHEKDDGFIETLTKPLCAPCNEEFFNSTTGKYGLSNKNIISNGSFCITYHNTETRTVIISNNEDYNGSYKAIPKSVQISYGDDYKDIYSAFGNDEADIGTIECSYMESLSEKGNKNKLFYNTNYVLYLSDKLVSSSGTDLRQVLTADIDIGALKANITDYYKTESGIIPSINIIDGKVYRDTVGNVTAKKYNAKKAQKLLGDFDAACEVLNGQSVFYPANNEKIALLCNLLVQGWQKDLNLYINSKEETSDNIANLIKNDEILMAIIPVTSENNSAVSSFNSLSKLKIVKNADGYSAKKLFKAEQKLIDSGTIYPIVSIPTSISLTNKIDGFVSSADGKVLDFRFIKKS